MQNLTTSKKISWFWLSGKFLCSDNPLRVTSPKPGANCSLYVIPRDKLMFGVNTEYKDEWLFHQHFLKNEIFHFIPQT